MCEEKTIGLKQPRNDLEYLIYIGFKLAVPESVTKASFRGRQFRIGSNKLIDSIKP